MHGSNLPTRLWLAAIRYFAMAGERASSMQLGRELSVTQTTAWRMLRRMRHARELDDDLMAKVLGKIEACFVAKE